MSFWVLVLVLIRADGAVAVAAAPAPTLLECQSAAAQLKEEARTAGLDARTQCIPSDDFGLKHPEV